MSPPTQSEAFKKAVVDSKKLTSKPSSDDLLALYGAIPRGSPRPRRPLPLLTAPSRPGLYKVAIGEDISTAGKAKKGAWQKIVDEGITAEQAQERYVALVEKMKETYGYDENKEPEAVGA
ncbi:acyl CoA binding protein [Drechmeria coniospora]|uniref:Acyl CoA binding protein n=1 Tax=Drechmeria coniospora TaxID=98403 RepID=A0A151GQK7_DRECN|nr:acyl CoA binding protein [Drechmeria coniospora]KYK59348.1 acyl CoA binding protein [Drechmeria coniospora]